jgi:SAM-dependent methyltransferase
MDEESVARLYRLALRREPDAEALAAARSRIDAGTLSSSGLLAELVESDEFARVRAIDDGIALATRARVAGERPHALTAPAGTDERVIEIPWVLARYRGEPRVLDLGSANGEPAYLEALAAAAPAEPLGVDLVEAHVPGLRTLVGDLRRLPLDSGSIDVVLCISTLEHVGADQEIYGVEAERDGSGIAAALAEVRRVLAPSGRALVTVPCGADEDHGWFVQHDREGWNRLFAAADLYIHDQELYVAGPGGWRAGDDDTAAYGARGPAASAVLCSELHPGRLRHLALRSARRLVTLRLP